MPEPAVRLLQHAPRQRAHRGRSVAQARADRRGRARGVGMSRCEPPSARFRSAPRTRPSRAGRRRDPDPLAARARALSGQADRAPRALGARDARAHFHRPARCRRGVAHAELRADAGAGARHRPGAHRPRPLGRAAGRDPVGQRPGARAARAGGDARRRALCADLARVFADLHRPREAALHPAACSRRAWCSPRTANSTPRPSPTAVPPSAELVVTEAPPAGRADDVVRRTARRPLPTRRGRSGPRRGGPGHHCEDPVHVGLHRAAQGRHQYPAHAVQQSGDACRTLPYLREVPPVIVDWLPWNHTFGGNHNFGLVLYNGGTLYIDDGKPLPGLFERTVRNLREIAPTVYFNVPRGFEELVPYLQPRARAAGEVLQPRRHAVLRRGRTVATGMGRVRRAGGTDLRRAHPLDHRPGRDRDRAVRHLRQLGSGTLRHDRAARRGTGDEARARRATSSKLVFAARTSRPATGGSPSSPAPRSTKKATTGWAMPCASPTRTIPRRA